MFLAALFLEATIVSSSTSFDLRNVAKGKAACSSEGDESRGDIVVCANRGNHENTRIFESHDEEEGPPQAEFGLFGNVRAKIHTERANVGGFTSNRAMVTVTVPF